jgi:hypothetical protein
MDTKHRNMTENPSTDKPSNRTADSAPGMTPEQQRIAIAEHCGWTETTEYSHLHPYLTPEAVSRMVWLDRNGQRAGILGDPPDYLNDLNAMHEAEKTMTDEQFWPDYYDHLAGITTRHRYGQRPIICATAAQRAEAFLRTVGKWQEASK